MKRALLAAAALVSLGAGPSPVIIPQQTIPLERFSHRVHLEQGIDCEQCHEEVAKSRRASDNNIPKESSCELCHEIQAAREGKPTDPPSACNVCHPGFDPTVMPGGPPRVVLPPPNLKFTHERHIREGIACQKCHGDMSQVDFATRERLPRMARPAAYPLEATCFDCHDGKTAPQKCTTCHLALPDGRMQTSFLQGALVPVGTLRGDDHRGDWLRRHREVAARDEKYCLNCHAPSECLDCHAGTAKPFAIHPSDWILTHPTAARVDMPSCTSCHREQSFCVTCHQRSGVAKETDTFPAGRAFHPAGWGERRDPYQFEIGVKHHSQWAQANLGQCTSCHREETCTRCHGAEAQIPTALYRISPHPLGFELSCKRLLEQNPLGCAKCHGGAAGGGATMSKIFATCR